MNNTSDSGAWITTPQEQVCLSIKTSLVYFEAIFVIKNHYL